ncbi:helix-turn-helix transcriptional regulator [Thermus sp.]|uniref:helix-turn-helix domain-containing protein n=1 Tax=Thermus sp. TaxID=275 RepID=UPI00298F0A84|nr:helix-turn-helix transcriptional regulator [Thermus sp.]MDW8357876.1 helix-turn-helix transcriptional regulator [Thermus sp.]
MRYRLRIKELLRKEGLPVNQVALALKPRGVGRSTVYGVVNEYQKPSLDMLEKLHGALEELLGREVALDELIQVVRE